VIVADANLWIALLLDHEKTDVAQAVFAIDPQWHVPLVCLSEIRNAGMAYVRRSLVSGGYLADALAIWRHLVSPGMRHDVDDALVIDRAMASGCTAYDCEYVVAAQLLEAPLLTWDKQVLKTFPDVAVTPEEFIAARR
jgi:predicted nucleic acid-binding protein